MIEADNRHPKEGKKDYFTTNVETTVFNSGLWTIWTAQYNNAFFKVFLVFGGPIIQIMCFIFWGEQILGVALLEITVHRQNKP